MLNVNINTQVKTNFDDSDSSEFGILLYGGVREREGESRCRDDSYLQGCQNRCCTLKEIG